MTTNSAGPISEHRLLCEALRIRLVEEKIIELYPSDVIQSPVHLSIGQEAVAVGVSQALEPSDWVFINYRGHAFYLARGAPLPEFFAELMGRATGLSKGKAGSMHLAAPAHGVMGASAVVASTIPHAVGAALAEKVLRGSNRVFVADFGDGAMEQGVFFESLNFASLHDLPVLFLCEDNGLAVHTHLRQRQSFDVEALVKSCDISFWSVSDGYDPMKVYSAASKAVGHVRENQRPAFLRVATMRYREHVAPGEDFANGYRNMGQMDEWKSKDPLLKKNPALDQIASDIQREINQAVDFALASPYPSLSELTTDVL